MADMDLDDILDGTSRPSRAPARTVRFAPKGAKIQPRPKTEPSQSIPPSASDSMNSVPVPKKEEPVNNPVMKPEYANDAIKMDVELKPEVKEDLMETEAMEAEPEPGDEVVREIDVYLNHSVDPKTLVSDIFCFSRSIILIMELPLIMTLFLFRSCMCCNIHLGLCGGPMNWMRNVKRYA